MEGGTDIAKIALEMLGLAALVILASEIFARIGEAFHFMMDRELPKGEPGAIEGRFPDYTEAELKRLREQGL
jgi:hypothetical protein